MAAPPAPQEGHEGNNGVEVCLFDESPEEFSSAVRAISELAAAQSPRQNWEWRFFSYEPKGVSFTYGARSTSSRDDTHEITLPQFSSASVPQTQVTHLEDGRNTNTDRSLPPSPAMAMPPAPQEGHEGNNGVEVCLFDESPEEFSSAVRAISELAAGEPEPSFPDAEVERLASSITFLRSLPPSPAMAVPPAPQEGHEGNNGVEVCLFDESPEEFSSAVRAISDSAAGEPEPSFPDAEVERLASSITFLRSLPPSPAMAAPQAPLEGHEGNNGIEVCLFDESPEEFSSAVRAISELATAEPEPSFPDAKVERLASSITFLRSLPPSLAMAASPALQEGHEGNNGIEVCLFDESPEEFSSAVRAISELAAGEPEPCFPDVEVERLASSITLLPPSPVMAAPPASQEGHEGNNGVGVCLFDESPEEFSSAVHAISELASREPEPSFPDAEVERLASSITFLR
ncbi:hypothetical protein ACQ4PT_063923 [Festuca glaucescens]